MDVVPGLAPCFINIHPHFADEVEYQETRQIEKNSRAPVNFALQRRKFSYQPLLKDILLCIYIYRLLCVFSRHRLNRRLKPAILCRYSVLKNLVCTKPVLKR